jgi:hypothetical protein
MAIEKGNKYAMNILGIYYYQIENNYDLFVHYISMSGNDNVILPIKEELSNEKPLTECPICYDKTDFETNCGHQYCKTCIEKIYFNSYEKNKEKVSCAYCRTDIFELKTIKR